MSKTDRAMSPLLEFVRLLDNLDMCSKIALLIPDETPTRVLKNTDFQKVVALISEKGGKLVKFDSSAGDVEYVKQTNRGDHVIMFKENTEDDAFYFDLRGDKSYMFIPFGKKSSDTGSKHPIEVARVNRASFPASDGSRTPAHHDDAVAERDVRGHMKSRKKLLFSLMIIVVVVVMGKLMFCAPARATPRFPSHIAYPTMEQHRPPFSYVPDVFEHHPMDTFRDSRVFRSYAPPPHMF